MTGEVILEAGASTPAAAESEGASAAAGTTEPANDADTLGADAGDASGSKRKREEAVDEEPELRPFEKIKAMFDSIRGMHNTAPCYPYFDKYGAADDVRQCHIASTPAYQGATDSIFWYFLGRCH